MNEQNNLFYPTGLAVRPEASKGGPDLTSLLLLYPKKAAFLANTE